MGTESNTERNQPAPMLVGGWLPAEQIPPHLRDLVERLRRDNPNGFSGRPVDEFEDDWRSDDSDDDSDDD